MGPGFEPQRDHEKPPFHGGFFVIQYIPVSNTIWILITDLPYLGITVHSDILGFSSYLNGQGVGSSVQGSIADCQSIGSLSIENATITAMEVYPNPFDNVLHINFSEMSDNQVKVELLDMKGRSVLVSEYQNETSVKINTDNVPSGLYMVYVNGAAHSKVVKY